MTRRRIKWLGGPGGELRECSECENKTRYWQPETEVPLCDVCAKRYETEYEWCVATPAGLTGPYRDRLAAQDAARPLGYPVVRQPKGGSSE